VKPKQPYVDWANSCDECPTKTTVAEIRDDCHAYLVPCWYDDEDFDRTLKKVAGTIFESELSGWITDESVWPKRRGFETFRKWFDVEGHSLVSELGDGWIEVERG
jgi:hypothetical protein